MLRNIFLVSLSISSLWSASLPDQNFPLLARSLHQEGDANAEWCTSASVVLLGRGGNWYRNEPYGAAVIPLVSPGSVDDNFSHQPSSDVPRIIPPKPPTRNTLLCVDHSFHGDSIGGTLNYLSEAKTALSLNQISQDEYTKILFREFDSLMNNLQERYQKIKQAVADEALLSKYLDAADDAKRSRELSLFTDLQQQRLKCYEITFLIGAANITGRLQNNQGQLDLALRAKELIESLPNDVSYAYANGGRLLKEPTLEVCRVIIERALMFGRSRASLSKHEASPAPAHSPTGSLPKIRGRKR